MLELTVINAISIPDDDQEFSSGLHQNIRYGAVEINYIAVDEKMQHQGIGQIALDSIVSYVRHYCKFFPVRYIVLDALKEKVKWYEDNGFFKIGHELADCPTVKMLMDLCDHEKLEQYIEEST